MIHLYRSLLLPACIHFYIHLYMNLCTCIYTCILLYPRPRCQLSGIDRQCTLAQVAALLCQKRARNSYSN